MRLATLAALGSVLFIHSAWSQEHLSKQLERINFFPKSEVYVDVGYEHQRMNIETPQDSILTKEVNNYANQMKVAYAERIARKMFLGARLFFEQASENGVMYGVPLRQRFDSAGFKEPEVFMTYRLRHQNEKQGLIALQKSITC